MTIAAQYKEEDGHHTASATYNGQAIEVVAGYDIVSDRFLFHVYVTPKGTMRAEVECSPNWENSKDKALEAGLEFARHWVDANPQSA